MSLDFTPRALIETSRRGSVDAELKSLKLLSRRLQANLTLLATELQLLHRLYYKNKNQHRGALFWRSITEVRRYLEKVAKLNLQGSIPALRSTFYGSADASGSMKGPWTHFPNQNYLSCQINQYETSIKLMEKISEVCLRAYKSFHRSLQSAAFLQILLMFVAISSRTRAISLELQDILTKTHCSTKTLFAIASTTSQHVIARSSPPRLLQISEDADVSVVEVPTAAPYPLSVNPIQAQVVSVVIKRTVSEKPRKNTEQTSGNLPKPKRKKHKITTDEIDDIFGF